MVALAQVWVCVAVAACVVVWAYVAVAVASVRVRVIVHVDWATQPKLGVRMVLQRPAPACWCEVVMVDAVAGG